MKRATLQEKAANEERMLARGTPRAADIAWTMQHLRRALPDLDEPAVEKIARRNRKRAFRVLIGTLLSARTQDATTHAASMRLFRRAPTPKAMERLSVREIERLIYPVSFYRTKARHVKETCRLLLQRFGGQVPGTMEQLLTLPGVGRKTANLVLILAHGSRENICVDTHVHRISNRLGWVSTRTPEQTEQALYRAIPPRWWPDVNLYLVTWGQNVCRPIGPRCRACVLAARCPSARVSTVT
jgi:endonuclease III